MTEAVLEKPKKKSNRKKTKLNTYKAYKTELKLNNKEKSLMLGCAGLRRFAYNWALSRVKNRELKPNAWDIVKEWNAWKLDNLSWHKDYSSRIPSCAFEDLEEAFKKFFKWCKTKKGRKVGFPKYKSKYKGVKSFRISSGNFRVESGRIKLPRIGWLRLAEKDYIPKDQKIVSVTISERAGKWFISVLCGSEETYPPLLKNKNVIGIDLGIKTLATCSDGKVFENLKPLKQLENKLARYQKKINVRQTKGSSRQKKAREKVAKLHYRIANMRKDAINKATTNIARTKNLSVVVLEDLSVQNMMKNSKLSKAVGDASFYEFRRQLEYKSKMYGFEVHVVSKFFPSSKTCSNCGHVKEDLSLSEREYVCENSNCNHVMDRDLNAAINLRNEYKNSLSKNKAS